MPKNIFYAQSGGPTAVINASACGIIETARQHNNHFGKVFAGQNGILGALEENLIDTDLESDATIAALKHTPGAAFGSCRMKLKSIEEDNKPYKRLIEVFKAHDIGTFFYNGGGDSQDTAYKVSQLGATMGYPLTCIGIPKTVDNDLMLTDNCPGFGSVAKYLRTSVLEASLDVRSMAKTSTKVFVLEAMGRHTGWIAAACGIGAQEAQDAPHIILFPEVAFDQQAFLKKVNHCVETYGYCVIVASEGIRYADGTFLSEQGGVDAFGHAQLGGVAPLLANIVKDAYGYKYHWAVPDYLQRSARHIASKTDVDQAYAVGKAAVLAALEGKNNIMMTIERTQQNPYQWQIGQAPLSEVANHEKTLPPGFITEDGMHITSACQEYLRPLIQGESYPPYKDGLPNYAVLKAQLVAKQLKTYT
jgi:6-phosphofructokinase 1